MLRPWLQQKKKHILKKQYLAKAQIDAHLCDFRFNVRKTANPCKFYMH